jgi:hypothetical protein
MKSGMAYAALLALALFALDPHSACAQAHSSPGKEQGAEQATPPKLAQPVVVSDLIGLPILDENSMTMGHVRGVVRNEDGTVHLLMPIGGLFGFGERLVTIPVESVAMRGKQVAVTDMPPHRFQKTPTWYGSKSDPVPAGETIQIAVTK